MTSPFEELPVEIVEKIVCLLDLADASSLRLVSGTLAAKASQGSFRRFFTTKSVDLTGRNLKSFVRATEAGSLGCLVENVIVVGLVWNAEHLAKIVDDRATWVKSPPTFTYTQVKLDDAAVAVAEAELKLLNEKSTEAARRKVGGSDASLLQEAFGNIVANGKSGGLRSLSMEVVVYREDSVTRTQPGQCSRGWELTWEASDYTFQTSMSALAGSGLEITELCLFGEQQKCSIAANRLNMHASCFAGAGMRKCLSELKTLSVSFSLDFGPGNNFEPEDDYYDDIDRRATPREPPASSLTALSALLKATPALLDLNLHFYSTRTSSEQAPREYQLKQAVFDRIAHTAPLPNLRKCRLRGLSVSEGCLLTFLRASPLLQSLSLDNVHMAAPGTFAPVLNYLASEAKALTYLHLDELWATRLLYFEGEPGLPKFPSTTPHLGPNEVTRDGREAVTRVVRAVVGMGRPMGSPQAHRWYEGKRKEYGPP